MRLRYLFAASIVAAAVAAASTTPTLAQQVTLKLHHFVPAQANQQKFWFEPWAKKLEQESGGKLKIEIYPSMQLGGKQPQLYDQAKDGVVDIVWTVAGTTPGRFPRLEVFELPFLSHAIGEKTAQAVWDFYQAYAKDELKDVKPLAVWGFGKGTLFTKDVVIKTPADAKGLKLRASNRQTNDAFALIGAHPQSIPPPGVPEALAKGVVDGVVFPYDAVIPFKLDELKLCVRRALSYNDAVSENVYLKKQLRKKYQFSQIIGSAQPMQDVFKMIERVADFEGRARLRALLRVRALVRVPPAGRV